jgi:hypothetical protein
VGTLETIEATLASYGVPSRLDPDEYFGMRAELSGLSWRPTYLFTVDGTTWAISVFVGDLPPEVIIEQMKIAGQECPDVHPTFFVPEGQDHDQILQVCMQTGIAVIARVGGEFEFLPLGSLPAIAARRPRVESRIPLPLVRRSAQFTSIDPRFAGALSEFSNTYVELASEGRLGAGHDIREEELLRRAFEGCLQADARFAAPYNPLEVIRFLEQQAQQTDRRDHFFHTFHDFLLGCVVINEAHEHFREFATRVIGDPSLSVEYIWLLASLFHDVGYAAELDADIDRLVFGPSGVANPLESAELPDHVLAQRQAHWGSPTYLLARRQLVSLWDHLTDSASSAPWVPEPVAYEGLHTHVFDRALYRGFMGRRCHGVASCLRLLAELHGHVSHETTAQSRQFLYRHIYLAALSVPFHHDAFRQELRCEGIDRLSTRSFPFASLLMFIDSIQDDRREWDLTTAGPDILRDVSVDSGVVTAVVDLQDLTERQVQQVARKRTEALDVLDFLEQDGLAYRYPAEFMGEADRSAHS